MSEIIYFGNNTIVFDRIDNYPCYDGYINCYFKKGIYTKEQILSNRYYGFKRGIINKNEI